MNFTLLLCVSIILIQEVNRTPDPFGIDIRPRSQRALDAIMLAGKDDELEGL